MRKGISFSEAGKLGAIASAKYKNAQKLKRIDEYNKNPKLCRYCNEALKYDFRKNKFCNQSCAASFNNCGKQKNYVNGKWAKKICITCGQETTNSKYCSIECNKEFEWKLRKQQIEKDQIIISPSGNSKTARKYLLEKCGNKCEICYNTEWNGKPIPVVLDHIDGHSENWNLSNLRLICPNCDAQTDTYKGKNKGNGRHSRRQRYKEGKSY